mmetsp:Transcript_41426/g.129122  ORF Transcript_41426/g.129122 Transcript_41426/m.129122 type:complete len:262 (+) Transcript_41426:379-1164(+)
MGGGSVPPLADCQGYQAAAGRAEGRRCQRERGRRRARRRGFAGGGGRHHHGKAGALRGEGPRRSVLRLHLQRGRAPLRLVPRLRDPRVPREHGALPVRRVRRPLPAGLANSSRLPVPSGQRKDARPRYRGGACGRGGTPPTPGGPGPRVSNALPWAARSGGAAGCSPSPADSPSDSPGGSPAGSGMRGGFEPLLPPAAEALGAAAGAPVGERRRGTASSALRAPVPLDGVLQEGREGWLGEPRDVEFAERRDEFARSGFRY